MTNEQQKLEKLVEDLRIKLYEQNDVVVGILVLCKQLIENMEKMYELKGEQK